MHRKSLQCFTVYQYCLRDTFFFFSNCLNNKFNMINFVRIATIFWNYYFFSFSINTQIKQEYILHNLRQTSETGEKWKTSTLHKVSRFCPGFCLTFCSISTKASWIVWNSCARSCNFDVMTLPTNQDFPITTAPTPTPPFLRHERLYAIALKSHHSSSLSFPS